MSESLKISKAELFKLRDNGTFKLGQHYAAFDHITFSRDSYLWNERAVKRSWRQAEAQDETSFASAA